VLIENRRAVLLINFARLVSVMLRNIMSLGDFLLILCLSFLSVWLGGVVIMALDLRLDIAGPIPAVCTVECALGQVVHTHFFSHQAV